MIREYRKYECGSNNLHCKAGENTIACPCILKEIDCLKKGDSFFYDDEINKFSFPSKMKELGGNKLRDRIFILKFLENNKKLFKEYHEKQKKKLELKKSSLKIIEELREDIFSPIETRITNKVHLLKELLGE